MTCGICMYNDLCIEKNQGDICPWVKDDIFGFKNPDKFKVFSTQC